MNIIKIMSRKIEKELYSIVIDKNYSEQPPLFCDVCCLPMIMNEDDISYSEFKCCDHCSTMWAYQDKDKWKNGWRPEQDIIDKDKKLRTRISNKFIL